ncbi:GNAT family N-acetyltransferase [Halomonas sabkhae]|uniref:GNAT family N-acetyltransferase n=1 Tax=Halomonas sabkhae TaxID=626223 RepID=UPI003F496E77
MRADCGPAGVPSVFAAMSGERPVGMASLVVDDMSDRRDLTPWLASVFVLPEWRGHGIASRLVRRVEEEAEAHGVGRCYLYTPDQQSLYRRLGWQDVEEREYRGEVVTIMQRDLQPRD